MSLSNGAALSLSNGAAQALEMRRLHDVVRTGTVLRYLTLMRTGDGAALPCQILFKWL